MAGDRGRCARVHPRCEIKRKTTQPQYNLSKKRVLLSLISQYSSSSAVHVHIWYGARAAERDVGSRWSWEAGGDAESMEPTRARGASPGSSCLGP
eukprot:2844912-Rhodomonas_salina.1